MDDVKKRPAGDSGPRVVTRVVVYYAILLTLGWLVFQRIPRLAVADSSAFEALFGLTQHAAVTPQGDSQSLDESRLAIAVIASMVAAILLSLPVAWVYLLTRAKRGYQQSVVQLLIILPLVVAGIVVMVKYSLALAFSLAGIVAAVRFRNTLDDSKDAVYVFLATAIGLASAVNIPVAAVISIIFNATMLVLWATDFGHSPVALDGTIGEKRLKRARDLSRTGTFVAQIDNEVLKNMNREQLEGVAERAWKRAHASEDSTRESTPENTVRVVTNDSSAFRAAIEPRLAALAKKWVLISETTDPQGTQTLNYTVKLGKQGGPDELESFLRAAGSQWIVSMEVT